MEVHRLNTIVTFDDVIKKIRIESKNTRQLGDKFESLMINFLRSDSIYKKEFDKIWKYGDWAREYDRNIKDLGIDIIAQIRTNDKEKNFCAIQCKCWEDDHRVEKEDIDTFFAETAKHNMIKPNIKELIVISTSNEIGDTAWNYLNKTNGRVIDKNTLRSSSIDWSKYPKILPKKPKTLRDYQDIALNDVLDGFKKNDRGKLIMACGTGKTLVSLHIAEKLAGKGKLILYLVPSISLILQSMREWSDNANIDHYYMAVCSDKSVKNSEDGTIIELESPASTDFEMLKNRLNKAGNNTMNVIFCTYNSIDVVSNAMNGKKFDIIFSDEAHRTTSISNKSFESFYSKVHYNKNINAIKRLYMTATPRIYTGDVKGKAQAKEKEVVSMDDQKIYGSEFHHLKFRDAVHKYGALCDFKIHVTIMDGNLMDKIVQKSQSGDDNMIPLDEKTLLSSVWHAIQYPEKDNEPNLLQRIIMFCDIINSSKLLAGQPIKYKQDFLEKPKEEQERLKEIDGQRSFKKLVHHINQITGKIKNDVEIKHIDGSDNAQVRRRELEWLKSSNENPNECRILSNARCLSEGVDVPALDGIVFLNPRKSIVDVVQAVGRVMRKSKGKDFGYVILPVALPAGISHDAALSENKYYKIVWQVLSALKSHDEDLSEEINRLTLTEHKDYDTQITPRIIIKHAYGHDYRDYHPLEQKMINGVATKIIERIGDSYYYDKYGQKLGSVTHTITARLLNKMKSNSTTRKEIQQFHESLKQMINDSVTEKEAIQAISQHMVLSRVFDVLFAGMFTSHNPISLAFNNVIKKIRFEEELDDLEEFYSDVKREISQLKTNEERQNFIKKIYGNFFVSADKKGTEKHGVVYTPVEVIDFIINSVQYILKKEFNTEFNNRSVKVMDPFAGTGTFLTRLLESGFIQENIYEKYKHDLIANEMILLAYYIATVNIETTYQSLRKGNRYVPFEGISYTDTMKLNARYREDERHRTEFGTLGDDFKSAHRRIKLQRSSHIHVIIGNPPYSSGQNNYNEDNPNLKYDVLDERISNTYAQKTTVHLKTSLRDSYVRSLRWASDRIGNSGIIALVTNASFLKSETAQGIRASLENEFDYIWCYDLRGNARTQGDLRRSEGGNIFDSGSRAPVAIILLVKTTKNKDCIIKYHDVGDYITREEKLKIIKNTKSIQNIKNWNIVKPDKHNDWINQRNNKFSEYLQIGSNATKSGLDHAIFKLYSRGIGTSRDVWVYNSSKTELIKKMQIHIDYCNNQNLNNLDLKKMNPTKAKWSGELIERLKKHKPKFDNKKIRIALYRPFFKQHLYFDKTYNQTHTRIPYFYPENYSKNLAILIPYKYIGKSSVFITDIIPDLEVVHHGQCFPLYVYENNKDKKSNITDLTLLEYQKYYSDEKISKKDIFYYVYAMLHHSGYKQKFMNNLSRELPHIPMAPNFWKFSNIGKKLTDLHLNFDAGDKYDLGKPKNNIKNFHKLSFGTIKEDNKRKSDKTKLFIDGLELFGNLPHIEYAINGRTPVEWIVDRYKITTDKESGIINDPCTGFDIISHIKRAVYIGVESDKLINDLSKEEFEPENWKPGKSGLDAHM